jgi:hypothetical protein
MCHNSRVAAYCIVLLALVGTVQAQEPDKGFSPVDMRTAVNMGFKDGISGDGKGGWTDQGGNDMRFLPTGRQTFRGIPFDIIEPAKNDGKASLILFSTVRPYFPTEAEVKKIGRKARSIYFLHGVGWNSKNKVATYTVTYADGTKVEIPIRGGKEIDNWWQPKDGESCRVAWSGPNLAASSVGLLIYPWQNPHPDKAIAAIRFASARTKSITCIVAVTLSDGAPIMPPLQKVAAKDDLEFQPGKAATIGMKKVVGEVRKEDLLPPIVKGENGYVPAMKRHSHTYPGMHVTEKLPMGGVADMSFLNEKPAGKHGFLGLKDGKPTFADGTPARFMSVNNTYGIMWPDTMEEARQRAQWIAANGINLIRIHHWAHSGKDGQAFFDFWEDIPKEKQKELAGSTRRHCNTRRLDPVAINKFDMYMAALKEQGVYVHISAIVFPWLGFTEAVENNIPPRGSGYHTYRMEGAQIFIKEYIEKHKGYLKALLEHKNPYTGLRYVDDPMFASFELMNEDSIFWRGCDPNRLSGYYFLELHELWNNWLLKKYGSTQKLRAAWGADALDDWETVMKDVNFMKRGATPEPQRFDRPAKGFTPMDLASVVNTTYTDRYARDAKDGWMDIGKDDDMRFFPTGKEVFLGVPFAVSAKGPVIIADTAGFPGLGKRKDRPNPRKDNKWPKSVALPVAGRARTVYFLHTAGWMPGGGKAFMHYDVEYADGTKLTVPIRRAVECGDWSDPTNAANLRVAWRGMALSPRSIGVSLFAWENPHAERPIARIVARTEGTEATIAVLGVTLSDAPPALPSIQDTPSLPEWKAFVRLMGYTRFTKEGWTPPLLRRASDQIRFLYEVQAGYFRDQRAFIEGLGWKGLVLGSGWKTPALMQMAERYMNAELDVLDQHNYGSSNGFMRNPGAGTMTTGPLRVLGKPIMISEYYPRREEEYRLCVYPLLSLYAQGLNGWEFPMQFSTRRLGWGFYEHWDEGMNYTFDLSQYPAMALAVRRGDIKEGPVVYKRMLSKKEIFAESVDTLKVEHPYEKKHFVIGKVGTVYTDDIMPDFVDEAMVEKCWDKEAEVVTSATGELVWDYGKGIAICRTPRTQGAVGFLNRIKTIDLPGADLSVDNPFAAVWFSSLDGKPIVSSEKVLITLASRAAKPVNPKKGGASTYLPVIVESVAGRISLKSSLAAELKIYAVDWDGRPLSKLRVEVKDGKASFFFDTMNFEGPYILATTAEMPLKKKR